MRWHILKTLLRKELHRQLANRAGMAFASLLVAAALLLSVSGASPMTSGSLAGRLSVCYVDYEDENPWIAYLKSHLPSGPEHMEFRRLDQAPVQDGKLVYEPGAGAIQVRKLHATTSGPRYQVWFWQPDGGGASLASYEAWFWKESHRYFAEQATSVLAEITPGARGHEPWPIVQEQHFHLEGGTDTRFTLATSLILFALFFVCVYLLSSSTCEERERGLLLAQALSPASPGEILAAKFLFYPGVAVVLAATLAGISSPGVLIRPIFWLALIASALGSIGVGLTIASWARTQRGASMGALCYMMAVALLILICQQNRIPVMPYLALEYHSPRVINAALSNQWAPSLWFNVAGIGLLAAFWASLATALFRRKGWQ